MNDKVKTESRNIDTANPITRQRRNLRLKGHDYSQDGLYFVTISCHGMVCRFGNIVNHAMVLNDFGLIAKNEWMQMPERFPGFIPGEFQVMPNHFHAIITLDNMRYAPDVSLVDGLPNTGTGGNAAQTDVPPSPARAGASPAPTDDELSLERAPARGAHTKAKIGDIVGAYKSLVSNKCLAICKSRNVPMGKLWQRNYYEHIIRNEYAYEEIANYIMNNPLDWKNDRFYTK